MLVLVENAAEAAPSADVKAGAAVWLGYRRRQWAQWLGVRQQQNVMSAADPSDVRPVSELVRCVRPADIRVARRGDDHLNGRPPVMC
ncbi:MAG: hypothetical protein M3Z75_13815 [Actinomycetota bacterium]|jgi:hypothetical protein|nr:hypothetical protein [Actinomycetota bacterium]